MRKGEKVIIARAVTGSIHTPTMSKFLPVTADEEPHPAGTADLIYPDTFKMIERAIREVGDVYGARFGFECHDVGHLYTFRYLQASARNTLPGNASGWTAMPSGKNSAGKQLQ